MAHDTGPLITAIEQLTGHFRTLKTTLELERKAISERDLDGLEKYSTEVADQLEKIREQDLDRQRQSLIIAQALSIPNPKQVTLKALDEALGSGTPLLKYRESLIVAIEQADRANRENQAAFRGVMAATESMLQAMGKGRREVSYDRLGGRRANATLNVFSKQL
ncbi:MAG: flagellar protein FlgN [Magnetococcales bacterium]|nr:flagellar protein FlgN [Magnetococcales bacterium]